MSDSLYVLTGKALLLKEMASDQETDPAALADTMESLNFEIEEKAEAYAKIIRMLLGEAEVIDVELKRLSEKKKTLENNADRMKRNLEQSMITLDKKQFKTTLFSFNIQKNPATVNVTGKVPKRFYIPQEPKLDKKALLAYVKEHGNTKYAELAQSESLRIR